MPGGFSRDPPSNDQLPITRLSDWISSDFATFVTFSVAAYNSVLQSHACTSEESCVGVPQRSPKQACWPAYVRSLCQSDCCAWGKGGGSQRSEDDSDQYLHRIVVRMGHTNHEMFACFYSIGKVGRVQACLLLNSCEAKIAGCSIGTFQKQSRKPNSN